MKIIEFTTTKNENVHCSSFLIVTDLKYLAGLNQQNFISTHITIYQPHFIDMESEPPSKAVVFSHDLTAEWQMKNRVQRSKLFR